MLKDEFINYLKEGKKTQAQLIAKLDKFKRYNMCTQEEYDEILILINEHFGA